VPFGAPARRPELVAPGPAAAACPTVTDRVLVPGPDPRVVLAVVAATTTTCVFPAFLVGAMAVQVRADLGIGESGTGLSVAAFFVTAALSSALLGGIAEGIGPARALRAAAIVSGAGQLAVAALVRSLPLLLALLAVSGTANALAQPAANVLIARHVPLRRQGIAFAVKQSAIPISTMLAGLAVPAIALTVGWRWAFVVGGSLAIVAGVAAPRFPEPRRVRGATRSRRGPDDAPRASMALLAAGISLGAASAGTLGAFLVSSGVEAGMGESSAGLLLTVGSAIGVTMRLLSGSRADRRGSGHLRVVAMMLLGGAIAYVALAVGSAGSGGTTSTAIHLLATPLAFGAGWAWPGLFNLAIVRVNPTAPGLATGITQTGTYAGAVIGPLAFGVLAEQVSYTAAWSMAAVLATLAAVLMAAGRASLIRHRTSGRPGPAPTPVIDPPPT
jgi:MFS family permease